MTLTQTIREIKETVHTTGTDKQKATLDSMSVGKLNEMVHIAQSMGVSSAISMYL